MDNIFEYYTLKLTAKSPVFVGSGQSVSKKEFCYSPKKNKIRFMNMEKVIEYLIQNNKSISVNINNRESISMDYLELFERFMLDDYLLKRLGENGKKCFTNGLNSFLNLIEMPVRKREECTIYMIDNDGVFEEDRTICEIQRFMRGADGRAYIPGSSVKGMLKTALLQYLIRKNPKRLPAEKDIQNEGKNYDSELINTLTLKYKDGIPNKKDAVNSIMRGISISDSYPVSNDRFTVCKKIDVSPRQKINIINTARECIKPETEVTFNIKVDKRYFRPVGIDGDTDFERLFKEIVAAFDNEYRSVYTAKFELTGNAADLINDDFLILGGGSGYFSKNIIYTRYGYEYDSEHKLKKSDHALKKVSDYMKLKKFWNPETKSTYQPNPDDYGIHHISPHMIKLTKHCEKYYHFGICKAELERKEI